METFKLLTEILEPQAAARISAQDRTECVVLSIAISLKRIADRLDDNTSHTYNEPAFRARGDMA